jgi:hypothetical protein
MGIVDLSITIFTLCKYPDVEVPSYLIHALTSIEQEQENLCNISGYNLNN